MNAFGIDKKYEGRGYISQLVKMAETYAKDKVISYLTIECEAKETRNLSIYLQFGYAEFVKKYLLEQQNKYEVLR